MTRTMAPARAAFGRRPRAPRRVLLVVVFGVLLVVVGVTAMSQAAMISVYATSTTLNAIVQSDMATLRGFVHQGLPPSFLEGDSVRPDEVAALERLMGSIVEKGGIMHVEVRRPNGLVVAATEGVSAGALVPPSESFSTAVGKGEAQLALIKDAEAEIASGGSLGTPWLLREYMPLILGGEVVLVVGLWRDAAPVLAAIDDLRRNVVVVTITGAAIAAAVLFLVFRAAQGRLARQAQALLDASQRDPLTGLLNHGALVGLLAGEIERARADGSAIGVALMDVDGFRLLNDSHGHSAGDQALTAIATLLAERTTDELVTGRFGPDEFLIVSTTRGADGLETAVEDVRDGLAGISLEFEATERLPVTVSVGVCIYPRHGSSVTTLLSAAVRALEEAKASGGNAVQIADVEPEREAPASSTFDVLKGLVLAIDTKDRYTKRHSEDVARYGIFIAEQLGLDAAVIHTIQVSGLLHDIGKIGIPDEILRKPGPLTDAEMEVMRRHVALGDLIVRELPDIDAVRAGVRHHHERWDGHGYLHGLAGEEIPLIARILAVGDAFSAMTTTRPYRKAFDVREALTRLGDAAGTQLDERIVRAFIDGLERSADPPLPGNAPRTLWHPMRRAA